ncbi:MAG: glycosyltransferase family 2 protein [Halocynthiibacter sp.]
MAKRPVMDPTKAPCGALTMVYQDYDILRRWVNYYEKHLKREHLYVLSHGGDPEHARIAAGCNVITIPRDPTSHHFDRRRWGAINSFHAGLMRYYNWMIVSDVDEFVLLDPDVGTDLVGYLTGYEHGSRHDGPDGIPKSLSPFGIELIHNPEVEPEALDPEAPILRHRRVFRTNANYSKPCVLRQPANFTVGGHANNHQPRVLDPHLYLLHLRFYDYKATEKRLLGRQEIREKIDAGKDPKTTGHAWKKDFENFKKLSDGKPVREDCHLEDFRSRMISGQQHLHNGKITFWGGGRSKELYRLPERFSDLV